MILATLRCGAGKSLFLDSPSTHHDGSSRPSPTARNQPGPERLCDGRSHEEESDRSIQHPAAVVEDGGLARRNAPLRLGELDPDAADRVRHDPRGDAGMAGANLHGRLDLRSRIDSDPVDIAPHQAR